MEVAEWSATAPGRDGVLVGEIDCELFRISKSDQSSVLRLVGDSIEREATSL